MRVRSPSSRASVPVHFYSFDVMLAALSPLFALNLRAAHLLSPLHTSEVVTYFIICFACSLIAFAIFKICGGIPGYLSVYDVMELAKAVLVAEFMICVIMFALNRLDGIPRSVPTVHALILGTGLVTARLLAQAADRNRKFVKAPRNADGEHVILIGMNDLSVPLMKFLGAAQPGNPTVVALLDEDARWFGRSLNGVRVYGPPGLLDPLIDEFAVHGISIDRVMVCGGATALSASATREVHRICARRAVDFSFFPDPFKFASVNPTRDRARHALVNRASGPSAAHVVPAYFRYKKPVERTLAVFLTVALLPLWLIAALLVLLDVGSPILFWQRRIGFGRRPFHIYKFRTLAHPVDRNGRVLAELDRLSWIGRMLRQSRLDELPQLLSVVSGDMALIGPRPLLPRDQPPDPSMRLSVRPGITGWAQVNGGTLLTPEEKEVLDTWYIRHASAWLDARIVAMTLLSLVRGDRRAENALMHAYRERGLPSPNGRLTADEMADRLGAAARDAICPDQPQPSAVPLT